MSNMIFLLVIALSISGCRARVSSTASAVIVECGSPRSFGAIPDDGIDDRLALQHAIDACAEATLVLEAGTYDVVTPPAPRTTCDLTASQGVSIIGRGDLTTVKFTGDNMLLDWCGLLLNSSITVRDLSLVTSLTPGTTVEQTHLLRALGPLHDIHVVNVEMTHPASLSKSGDCIQLIGYPPNAYGNNDRRIWNVEVDHNKFINCYRSGVAVHSGLHGNWLPTGHWSSRFHDNVFVDVGGQDFDGEGSGDTDGIEIDHNLFQQPTAPRSAASIEIEASAHVWLHDNVHNGRGLDIYGCSGCEFDHNVVEQRLPNAPVFYLRKTSDTVSIHDETYRQFAPTSTVVSLEQKIGAPTHVSMYDDTLYQHADLPALSVSGVVGFDVRRLHIAYDGAMAYANKTDAIVVYGGTGAAPVRTSGVVIRDSDISGSYRATTLLSGSYGGIGDVTMSGVRAHGTLQGIRCENSTGITGPVVALNNVMPANVCAMIQQ